MAVSTAFQIAQPQVAHLHSAQLHHGKSVSLTHLTDLAVLSFVDHHPQHKAVFLSAFHADLSGADLLPVNFPQRSKSGSCPFQFPRDGDKIGLVHFKTGVDQPLHQRA